MSFDIEYSSLSGSRKPQSFRSMLSNIYTKAWFSPSILALSIIFFLMAGGLPQRNNAGQERLTGARIASTRVETHPLVEQLSPRFTSTPGHLPSAGPFNFTVCALVTHEDEFIEEWITYHRLLGIQQFYLYDSRNTPSTLEKILPLVEDGDVVLHQMHWPNRDAQKGGFFHHAMLVHCQQSYAKDTEWIASFDVDEFMVFQGPENLETVPYRALQPEQISSVASSTHLERNWQFPLHDYLMRPWMTDARAIAISRNGEYKNVGILDLEGDLVTQRIVTRKMYSTSSSFGKIMLRAALQQLPLATFVEAHSCEPNRNIPSFGGVKDAGDADQFKDVRGQPLSECMAPALMEPIKISHYGHRSLRDCYNKFYHMEPSYSFNGRMTGGLKFCNESFEATPEQLSSPKWASEHPNLLTPSPPWDHMVEDVGIAQSWIGRGTAHIENAWKRNGGRTMSTARRARALEKVQVIHFPEQERNVYETPV